MFWIQLCLRKITNHDVIVFEKLLFQNAFRTHENEKLVFLNSSGSKSVFKKLRFPEGLNWTVGPTLEIKFRISPS